MNSMPRSVWIAVCAAGLLACGGSGGSGGSPEPAPAPADSMAATAQPAAPVVNGPEKVYDAQGRLQMEGQMKDGQRHGIWISYFPDGRVRSRSDYQLGRLQGVSTVFRPNGAMYYTGQYRNGKEVGTWRFYDEQGELARTVEYDKNGAVINDRAPAP